MSKTAINNEIVLMRHAVRKSRVSVVRKLIKEAKLLEARKFGDEKVLKKCKRKAEKLVAEINAAKKIKDDDVSKFGLTETRGLREILTEPGVPASTRITARLVFHKFLRERILQFREKFPSCEEFLGPGRKKTSKSERRAKREERNRRKRIGADSEGSAGRGRVDAAITDSSERGVDDDTGDAENGNRRSKIGEDAEEDTTNGETSERTGKKMKTAVPRASTAAPRVGTGNIGASANGAVAAKAISAEATVERFTDLMEKKGSSETAEETTATEKIPRKGITIEKEIDSFFLSGNGESEYMSVVVKKSVDHEEQEEEEEGDPFHKNNRTGRQKTFNEKNNKFLGKTRQPRNGDYANRSTRNADKYSRKDDRSKARLARSVKDNAAESRNTKERSEKRPNVNREEQVHPSWQARKKQQEILKQGFKGKRIVFDD